MNNLLSYCGLFDAKIRASDKDLPVQTLMRLGLHKDLDILLNLYTNKRIKTSENSIKTLDLVLKLKPQTSDARINLLQWLTDQDNIDDLGK